MGTHRALPAPARLTDLAFQAQRTAQQAGLCCPVRGAGTVCMILNGCFKRKGT